MHYDDGKTPRVPAWSETEAFQDWCLEQLNSKEYKSVVEEQRRQYMEFDKREKQRQKLREEAIREKAKREKERALQELREEETRLKEQFARRLRKIESKRKYWMNYEIF